MPLGLDLVENAKTWKNLRLPKFSKNKSSSKAREPFCIILRI